SQYNSYQFQEQFFYMGLMLIGLLIFFVKDISKNFINNIFELPLLNSFLQFPIVRGGIVIISALFLYNHYAEYYNGYVPVLLGTAWFYLVFVRTKYEKEVKEFVAILSAHREDVINNDQKICREHDIDYISFPSETKFSYQMKYLFFNLENIVSSVRFFGYVLKYDVQKLSDISTIKLYDCNGKTKIKIGKWDFVSSFSQEGLRGQFIQKGFQVECLERENTWREKFENIFRIDRLQLLFLLCFFGALGYNGGVGLPIAVFSVILFAVMVSKIIFKLEWIIVACFMMYQADLMSYRQSRSTGVVELKSFEEFNQKYKKFDLDLTSSRTNYDYEKNQFSIVENRLTYLEYENYLRLNPDRLTKNIPPFIHASSPREEAIDILYWHLVQKHEKFSSYKYGTALNDYCKAKGLGVSLLTNSCGILIDTKEDQASKILWDIMSSGPVSVLRSLPTNLLVKALAQDPELFYLFPNYFRKIGKVYSVVKAQHLRELKQFPERISYCHQLLLSDKEFVKDYILVILKGESKLSNEKLALIKQVFSQYRPLGNVDLKFWKRVEKVSPAYAQVRKFLGFNLDFGGPKVDATLIVESKFMKRNQNHSLYARYMNDQLLPFKEITDEAKFTSLVLELALNHENADTSLSSFWRFHPVIHKVLQNKTVDLSSLLKSEDKVAYDLNKNQQPFEVSPLQVYDFIFHPKVKIDSIKAFILPNKRSEFKRQSVWANSTFESAIKKFSKELKLAKIQRKSKNDSPAFARRLKLLKADNVKLQSEDKIFYYSMLKDNWRLILDQSFAVKDTLALKIVKEKVRIEINKRRLLLEDLPQFIQDLF
ncbi:hypothetical protein MJH12_17080, partial [bacterium]|nr:hypothetical protein [bacterium]